MQMSMNIEDLEVLYEKEDKKLTVALKGGLDTRTAPDLDTELKHMLRGVTEFILDLTDLEYITSAGLRVLLKAEKVMEERGEMIVLNPNSDVQDIFHRTGFENVLTIRSC